MAYALRQDLVHHFGETNIVQWANIDNDDNVDTIRDRINWSLEIAEAFVNARLILSRYPAPFDYAPRIITFQTGLLAGITLYDGRAIASTESSQRDKVLRHRKAYNSTMKQILNGQLRLVSLFSGEPIETTSKNFPFTSGSSTPITRELTIRNIFNNFFGIGFCSGIRNCCCHTCVCRSIIWPDDKLC